MNSLINRVIPCLLLQDEGLVKTQKFKNAKYIGDPINAVRIFNEKYVDELIFFDIRASRLNLEPDYDLIERIAGECFMPVCYGGGIKTLKQAKKLVALGIEKIAVNSAFIHHPDLVNQLVSEFGSQSVVCGIDVKKNFFGHTKVYDASLKKLTALNPLHYAEEMVALGVGEIFINDVDRDGMLCGYNLEFVSKLEKKINVPLIVCGGSRDLDDMRDLFESGASAGAAGSMFVLYGPHRAVLITYPEYAKVKDLFARIIS